MTWLDDLRSRWLGPRHDPEDNEQPACRIPLPRFFIARYPVTVAQWRVYYHAVGADIRASFDARSVEGTASQPVVWVSWHDALEYCRWLTRELRARALDEEDVSLARRRVPVELAQVLLRGDEASRGQPWVVTLPSEAEWERGARGRDGRRYPWGPNWDPNRANASETSIIHAPSSVGAFRGGQSPAGTEEQCGNLREWTRSLWYGRDGRRFEYPYQPDYEGTERENLSAPYVQARVVRGGAFIYYTRYVGVAYRYRYSPGDRRRNFGFRVVVSPFVDPLLL